MRARQVVTGLSLLTALVAGCQKDCTSTKATTLDFVVQDRPYSVEVPSTYEPTTAAPVVVLLHGFTGDATIMDRYVKLGPVASALVLERSSSKP